MEKRREMADMQKKKGLNVVFSYLPREISEQMTLYLERRRTSEGDVSEIRLRAHGPVSLVVRGENISLGISAGAEAMSETFKRVCGGAIYAHRDDVCRGFVTLEGGVRVGVSGHARYEGGALMGVSDVGSLVFRIPTGECSFARELYREWLLREGGMLICSRAGEGKTTAIRSLARLIGSGERPRRVVVVDERCEFEPRDYSRSHVDILRGYRRATGVDIAVRTMSAEVLIVDEISSPEDSAAMLSALGAGADVIATAHADSLRSALMRGYVRELVEGGLFGSVCVIERIGGRFSFSVEQIEENCLKI
ncbi:MAG: Flp pilus assembly complex ATPase component TadA [Clostridia bacterium]|nr:Flp pilus assembly complex ATPase component TadA [Clostridia bacterium]